MVSHPVLHFISLVELPTGEWIIRGPKRGHPPTREGDVFFDAFQHRPMKLKSEIRQSICRVSFKVDSVIESAESHPKAESLTSKMQKSFVGVLERPVYAKDIDPSIRVAVWQRGAVLLYTPPLV